MDLAKIPPHDIDAEQAVLGSMLTDKDAVNAAIETLKEDAFYREDNRAIYQAIINLYSKSEPIDIITLKDELESMDKFEQVGGYEYLASLPDKVPTTANVQKYIKIVEEKAILRNLIKTANEIIELGYDPAEDVEDIMDNAEKKIFDIMQSKNQKGYTPIKDVLVESFTKLEELYNRKQHITGVPTGFVELDYKTAGLHGSELILVAARPAMGKTAFALNIATNAALRGNAPVAIFSLEMSKDQLVNRILCSEAMVDSNKVRTGKLEEDDWVKLSLAIPFKFKPGTHFVYNALCAMEVGIILGISTNQIQNGIAKFELTKKRMDIRKLENGAIIINDAYNASYESMRASIEFLANHTGTRKIAVLGDMFELGEYSEELHRNVGKEVASHDIDVLICAGENSKYIIEEAQKNKKIETFYFHNNEEIVEKLTQELREGDIVLVKASNGMKFFEICQKL